MAWAIGILLFHYCVILPYKDKRTRKKDVKVRKAQAWIACHKLRGIWTSKLPRSKKIRVFRARVESILRYGSNTWTLTKSIEKSLDGCYKRMLRMVQHAYYKQRTLWRVTKTIWQNQRGSFENRRPLRAPSWGRSIQSCVVAASARNRELWMKTLDLHWQPEEGHWSGISFRNQNCNEVQGKMAGACQLSSGEFPAEIERAKYESVIHCCNCPGLKLLIE